MDAGVVEDDEAALDPLSSTSPVPAAGAAKPVSSHELSDDDRNLKTDTRPMTEHPGVSIPEVAYLFEFNHI